jgi:hypothetical protein
LVRGWSWRWWGWGTRSGGWGRAWWGWKVAGTGGWRREDGLAFVAYVGHESGVVVGVVSGREIENFAKLVYSDDVALFVLEIIFY